MHCRHRLIVGGHRSRSRGRGDREAGQAPLGQAVLQAVGGEAVGITLTSSFPAWAAGMILLGAGTAMVYPTLLAAIGDVAHPTWRAAAVGVYRFWRDAGFAVGAVAAGAARGHVQPDHRGVGGGRAHSGIGPRGGGQDVRDAPASDGRPTLSLRSKGDAWGRGHLRRIRFTEPERTRSAQWN
jgi:hypothetical protein